MAITKEFRGLWVDGCIGGRSVETDSGYCMSISSSVGARSVETDNCIPGCVSSATSVVGHVGPDSLYGKTICSEMEGSGQSAIEWRKS